MDLGSIASGFEQWWGIADKLAHNDKEQCEAVIIDDRRTWYLKMMTTCLPNDWPNVDG